MFLLKIYTSEKYVSTNLRKLRAIFFLTVLAEWRIKPNWNRKNRIECCVVCSCVVAVLVLPVEIRIQTECVTHIWGINLDSV